MGESYTVNVIYRRSSANTSISAYLVVGYRLEYPSLLIWYYLVVDLDKSIE
jgi:hypothetical protein